MTSDASPDSRLSQSDDPILPARHGRPAKAGSKRESGLIFNFDKQIDFIRRRYAKRIIDREPSPSEEFGYISFGDAVSDISQLIDEIWVSLTRMHTISGKQNIRSTVLTSLFFQLFGRWHICYLSPI